MLRKNFHQQLEKLELLLIEMGAAVESVIELAIEGLENQDLEKSRQAIKLDDKVDRLEIEIEKKCLDLFALQTPVAVDLRKISTILKMITDLERIGDYGVNIAYDTIKLNNRRLIKPLQDIPQMAKVTREMVKGSLDSFVNEDAELAKTTAIKDDLVDEIYSKMYNELLGIMKEDSSDAEQIVLLLFIGRHLERMADHATNICEKIVYMTTSKRYLF